MNKFTNLLGSLLDCKTKTVRRELNDETDEAIGLIENANWEPIEPVLEQARVLYQDERERSKSAETKSAIYLAVLAAIVPLSATIIRSFSGLFDGWQLFILMVPFLFAMAYVALAVRWIFKAIEVSGKHRVDIEELTKLKNNESVKVELCKEILKCVRNNRDLVNDKLTNVKKAHACLKGMLFSFVLLLILAGLMIIYSQSHEFIVSLINCHPTN